MSNPNSIQGGRWDEFFRRKFNLKGGTNTPELAAEIVPTIPLPFQLEDAFILRERLMIGRINVAAVAGEFARGHLTNPLDSGHLIIFEGIYFTNLTVTMRLGAVGGVLLPDASTAARVRDGRWARPSANAPGVGLLAQGTNAIAQGFQDIRIASGERGFLDFPVVLSPTGPDMVIIEGSVVNTAIQCTFRWREVVMEPSASG